MSTCLCLCGLKFKQQKNETCPDHLRNWELWMERRKCVHQRLAKKLERNAGDLVMNSGDILRSVKEEKLLLEYIKIENNFDKYRGNPDFWKLPCSLQDKSPPYGATEYFLVKSKEEKNEVPTIEYVGVPNVILNEKHIVPRTRNLNSLWCKSEYRQQVAERVSKRLLELQPHRPDMSNLVVLGCNFKAPIARQADERLPSIENHSDSEPSLTERVQTRSIKVNNKEFNEYLNEGNSNISVMFECFTESMVPCQQSIVFENVGQVAVRLYWRPYKKFKVFRDYSDNFDIIHPFKFDKNELLLLPDEKISFPVWFQTSKPGNYFEYWELTCIPKIWKRLIILLKGFASINNYEQRVHELTAKLAQMARNSTIKDLLSDLVDKGLYCAPSALKSFDFSEADWFESANLVQNVPKYVYNPAIVAELKEFYEETRLSQDPDRWNLSIKKLKENARHKDLFCYFDCKVALYDTAKLKRQQLKENPVEGLNKETVKKKTPKESLAPEPIEATHTSQYYSKLNCMLQKLEKPSIYPNKERKKYFFSWIILSTLFGKMLEQLDKLDNNRIESNLSTKPLKVKNSSVFPDRLLYEIFDESCILRTKRLSHGWGNAKPKSALVEGIAPCDVKKMHKTYFAKDEATQKDTKSEKAQKNKSPIHKQDEDLSLYLKNDFNPFDADEVSPNDKTTEAKSSIQAEDWSQSKPIDEEKYLIVYCTLCQVVDALVDTIEGFDDKSIPSDILGELLMVGKESEQAQKHSMEAMEKSHYFEFLRDLHWQSNLTTRKYFVEEKCQASDNLEIIDSKATQSLSNVFSLQDFKPRSEPYCLKDRAAQTDQTDDLEDYFPVKKSFSATKSLESCESKNVFYFLGNVEN